MSRCFQFSILVALFTFTTAEDSDPTTAPLSVGFVLFILSVACLCYYCCRRRRVPVTFERFSNEVDSPQNQHQPPRKRRFFGRGRNSNHTVNVVVNPILPSAEVPQRIQVSTIGPSAPMVPPPYSHIHPHPGQIYRPPSQMGMADHVNPMSTVYR